MQRLFVSKWSRNILLIAMIGMLFLTSSAFVNMQGQTTDPFKHASAKGTRSQLPAPDADVTSQALPNIIQDPSFEASYNSMTYWDQYSDNYGTPLCITADCGGGAGTTAAPRTGSVWAWFGGVDFTEPGAINPEMAMLSQSVMIPSCGATLQFYFWIGSAQAGSDTEDVFVVWLGDNTDLFVADATQKSLYPSYKLVSVNITPGTFTPGHNDLSFGSIISDQHVNFNLDDISLIPNCSMIAGNAGVAGATLTYTGGSATADGSGNYSFTVPPNWSGTVTPSKIGYTFLPASRTYTNVTTNQLAQNYSATLNKYTISGNAGAAGVTLSYTESGTPKTVFSQADGSYSFQVPHGWSGTVTPSKTNYVFSPASRMYTNVVANQPTQNYTATALYSISGNAGTAGVTLSYINGTPKTVTSQADGSYSFIVQSGWSGTVTPSKNGYIFSPVSRTYTNVTANQTAQNYTAIPLYSISGKVGVAGVTLSYTDGTVKTVTSQADGSYSLIVPSGWNGTVTPTHACFTFAPVDQSYTNVASNIPAQDYVASLNIAAGCADVDVTIGGTSQGRFGLSAGASTRASFIGLNSGPVKIMSTNNLPIIGAERLIYKVNNVNTSYSEMLGLPDSQLDTTYWLPWYNNVDFDTQLRFANVSDTTATIHVYVGGVEMGTGFTLEPGASTRQSFIGINDGPVKIESTVNIVAAERLIFKVNGVNTSYSELMALPNSQLDTTYWLPWYNNKDFDTQLRFANVSNATATVHVYVGGQEMTGSPFTLLAGESTRKSFPAVNNGPVQIVSDQNIVAAERLVYKVNGVNTSYSELMALPKKQLDTTYWLPWYNNKDFDTQLRFANVSDTTATVHVYIGGVEMGTGFSLEPGASTRQSFVGINNGPVRIESNVNIVVAERLIYKVNGVNTSYTELMGLANSQLDMIYWLPWYNNKDFDTQLRFGAP